MVNITITKLGLEKIAGATVEAPLVIEKFALGDGGGQDIEPKEDMTALVGEKYRGYINDKYSNGNNITCECVLPSSAEITEGFYIREIGLFDVEGTMIAIAKTPLQFRPASDGGNIVTELMFSIVMQVNNSNAITIEIPQSIFATVDGLEREIENREIEDNKLKVLISNLENTNLQVFAKAEQSEANLINLSQVGAKTITEYVEGLEVTFRAKVNSSNNMQVQLNGLGYKNIEYIGLGSYVSGDIKTLIYNKSNDNFEFKNIENRVSNSVKIKDFNDITYPCSFWVDADSSTSNHPFSSSLWGRLEVDITFLRGIPLIIQTFKDYYYKSQKAYVKRVRDSNGNWSNWI